MEDEPWGASPGSGDGRRRRPKAAPPGHPRSWGRSGETPPQPMTRERQGRGKDVVEAGEAAGEAKRQRRGEQRRRRREPARASGDRGEMSRLGLGLGLIHPSRANSGGASEPRHACQRGLTCHIGCTVGARCHVACQAAPCMLARLR